MGSSPRPQMQHAARLPCCSARPPLSFPGQGPAPSWRPPGRCHTPPGWPAGGGGQRVCEWGRARQPAVLWMRGACAVPRSPQPPPPPTNNTDTAHNTRLCGRLVAVQDVVGGVDGNGPGKAVHCLVKLLGRKGGVPLGLHGGVHGAADDAGFVGGTCWPGPGCWGPRRLMRHCTGAGSTRAHRRPCAGTRIAASAE